MGRIHSTAIAFASILSVAALSSTLSAQYEKAKPSPAPSPEHTSHPATRPMEPATTTGANAMSLTATLEDPEAKAKKQAATVKVATRGVRMVDPAVSGEKPIKGQGHLHYQVDDGPVIATTALKLSFHGLKPGAHNITVSWRRTTTAPWGPAEAQRHDPAVIGRRRTSIGRAAWAAVAAATSPGRLRDQPRHGREADRARLRVPGEADGPAGRPGGRRGHRPLRGQRPPGLREAHRERPGLPLGAAGATVDVPPGGRPRGQRLRHSRRLRLRHPRPDGVPDLRGRAGLRHGTRGRATSPPATR